MAREGSARRRRIWSIVVIGVVTIGVAGFVAFRLFADDSATAVPLDEALHRYRDAVASTTVATTSTIAATSTTQPMLASTTSSTPAPSPTVAQPGIYSYRTTGMESVDALGGTTHVYPAETTITITPDGCGVLLRWDALQERRDEWRLCATSDGITLQPNGLQYHEFYSQPDSEDVHCTSTVLLVPADGSPRPAVTQSCMLAADVWIPSWQVLGQETRTVDGTNIAVQHVQMRVDDNDAYGEQTTIDWYLDAHGLPIEVGNTKHSVSSSPIGSVVYDEQYTLELESLTPLQ